MKTPVIRTFITIFAAAAAVSSSVMSCTDDNGLLVYVDPKIGSGGHGHVFVGASVPFGMVQLGPTSVPQSWDWCSGYHSSDSTVIGFSHTHLNGTGVGDLFDVTVMPVKGAVTYARGVKDEPGSGLWSYADRSKEVARPEYYSVPLLRYGITAELTATARVGLHRYTFPEGEDSGIVIDLQNGGCTDRPVDTGIEIVDSVTVRGWRHSKGWAKNQKQYFHAVFSKPFDMAADSTLIERDGQVRYGHFHFSTKEGERVMLKVALSATGMEAARAAMDTELPGWNFERVRAAAARSWSDELGKIRIHTSDDDARKVFYTALYHTMIAPSLFCDVDGSYRGADGQVHGNPGHETYTTLSLWDTYRAAMPLYSIFQPERTKDIVETMVDIYDEQGKLPVWHLVGNETNCMVGNPGVIAVADAIVKGIVSESSRERAYAACRASVMLDERGQKHRKQYGFIPCDLTNKACAKDMEYAIADAAVANAAGILGHAEDTEFFHERSHSWRNYFDASTGFVRGRMADGSWRTPFDPFFSAHRCDYCEGNAWQYTWLAPHDLDGLIEGFGSRETMLERLDSLFTASSDLNDGAPADISGLIGQYVHGNEPSHHIVYLYTMAGRSDKAAERVRQILSEQYGIGEDGLSGNEDVGQMSAWYILSSLGFYQTEPASTRFWFGSPIWDRAEINVRGGVFTVVAENNSPENIYIRSVYLDGRPYTLQYIDFEDMKPGAELRFVMGPSPSNEP